MVTRIMALYKSPMARIRTNDALSVSFTISNRTRQGCPLLPLILILTLEPFLSAVQVNPSIHGVMVRAKEYKFMAFVNDLLFTLTQPLISLPNLVGGFPGLEAGF